jgi:hypothetical protein
VILWHLSGFQSQAKCNWLAFNIDIANGRVHLNCNCITGSFGAIKEPDPLSQGGNQGMRRRQATTAQITLRLNTALIQQLETRAKENRTTLSEEIRELIEDGLDPKPEPSLADFRGDWLRRLRDAIEHDARKEGGNIEEAWDCLRAVDAGFSTFYGDVETKLSRHVPNPQVRELLRGAPSLPNETKTSKVTQ